jgi:hypothetical protein
MTRRNGGVYPINTRHTHHIRYVGHHRTFAGLGGFEIPRGQLLPQEREPEETVEKEERPELSEDEALAYNYFKDILSRWDIEICLPKLGASLSWSLDQSYTGTMK